ncbi:c-type cytochrome [Vibrio renipiscarius]|uniref:Cytochrome C n=1 Tax=Vibrio renipiscarius TaxID=1461322 RepID=A0A0C2NI39_9VIBR|nr:cytochrome c [Vibrio renipiscarius]KII76096.1 cytochrome C [Vibrio renipiscarius]KII79201.1 cytochrome C [Vibrio renipiscarius]
MRLFAFLVIFLSGHAWAVTDIEQGKALYISPGKGGCATCHGQTGNEPIMAMYPKIGGQNELYLYNQMVDFKNKKRRNGLFIPMEVAMISYSDNEIRLIAKYLSTNGLSTNGLSTGE